MGQTLSHGASSSSAPVSLDAGVLHVNADKPKSKIQIRFHDGQRKIQEINNDLTVGDFRRFCSECSGGRAVKILAGFPQKPLEDDSITIEAAGLCGRVVTVAVVAGAHNADDGEQAPGGYDRGVIQQITEMGFTEPQAQTALDLAAGNVQEAINLLVENDDFEETVSEPPQELMSLESRGGNHVDYFIPGLFALTTCLLTLIGFKTLRSFRKP